MLVLTRRPGEKILIDGDIRLTVISLKGDRVRIGIEAPPTVVVDRQEVHEERMRNEEARLRPCHVIESDFLDRGVPVELR